MGHGPMTGRRMGRCTNYGATLKKQNATPSDNQTEDRPENYFDRGFRFGRGKSGRVHGMRRQNLFRGGN